MDCYLLMLYVTLEQEEAIQELFLQRRWNYRKKVKEIKETEARWGKQTDHFEELTERLETDEKSDENGHGIHGEELANGSNKPVLGFDGLKMEDKFGQSNPMIWNVKLNTGFEDVNGGENVNVQVASKFSLRELQEDDYEGSTDEERDREDEEEELGHVKDSGEGGNDLTNKFQEYDRNSMELDNQGKHSLDTEFCDNKVELVHYTCKRNGNFIKKEDEKLDENEISALVKGSSHVDSLSSKEEKKQENMTIAVAGVLPEVERIFENEKERKLLEVLAKGRYRCAKCHKKFSDVSTYNSHVKRNNCTLKIKAKYTCEVCKCTFTSQQGYRKHAPGKSRTCLRTKQRKTALLKMSSLKDENKAEEAKLTSNTQDNEVLTQLATLKEGKSEEAKLTSDMEDHEVLMQLARLKKGRAPMKRNFYCEECDRYFAKEASLRSHQKEGRCKFECEYCGKIFISLHYSNYKKHLACHRDERSVECTICNKQFRDERTLKTHKWIHSNEYPHVCSHCNKGFRQKSQLTHHIKVKHEGVKPMPLQCEKCGGYFSSKSSLHTHIKSVHKNIRSFECPQCGKMFKLPEHLRTHIVSHGDARSFQCEICSKLYKSGSQLATHKNRHFKLYKHFCKECGKGFYDRRNLAEHLRTHSGEKPFKCDYCDYRCAIKSNLGSHLRVHGFKKSAASKKTA